MFHHIRGRVTQLGPASVVLETGGVGYELRIPLSTYGALKGQTEATLLTHFHVREDEQRLYGFATPGELELFRLLLAVSGVGPAIALAALCALSPAQVVAALVEKDAKRLQQIKGVGRKLAERLIIELRDRLGELPGELGVPDLPATATAARVDKQTMPRQGSDAILALVRLGFDRRTAESQVEARLEHYSRLGQEPTVETLIKDCLRSA